MADNSTEAILAAIGSLGSKVDEVRNDIAGLKKTDEHLASEVFRIGEEQKRQGRELQELRAETLRTFESERHASAQTVAAITKHVDESATATVKQLGDALTEMEVNGHVFGRCSLTVIRNSSLVRLKTACCFLTASTLNKTRLFPF